MTEWKVVKLSDLGTIVGGATPSTSREDYYNGTIPWLTPKDLAGYSNRYISSGERSITQAGLNSCSAKLMPKNTVLFSSRAPIGYVAIAENDICTNQGFKSIVPNENTDYLFLYYLLKFNKNMIEALGSGTTFKEVSGATMRKIEVRVPTSIEVQRKIARILDSIDSKIENNRRINDNLEQQISIIYENMFSDISEPVLELNNIIEVRDGTHDSPKVQKQGHPLITSKHLLPYGVDHVSPKLISKKDYEKINERSLVENNDILMSMIGTIGLVSLVIEKKIDFAIKNVALFKTSHSKELVYYFLCFLKAKNTQEYIEMCLAGSTQKYISLSELRKLPLKVPDKKALSDFNGFANPIYNQIIVNINENSKLISVRDTLLQKLMSGELDISDIDL